MGAAENIENKNYKYTRKIDVVGLTKSSRENFLSVRLERWSKYGWTLVSYNEKGPLESFAEIGMNEKPKVLDHLLWLKEKYTLYFYGWCAAGILGLIFSFIFPPIGAVFLLIFVAGPVALAHQVWKSAGFFGKIALVGLFIFMWVGVIQQAAQYETMRQYEKRVAEQRYNQQSAKKFEDTKKVAASLKNLLRNKGVNESLVRDVSADPTGEIKVSVTNLWLTRPKHEQKQMKQIIRLLLKQIAPPNGWDYYVADYMGNRI